jgi:hypothetical protein
MKCDVYKWVLFLFYFIALYNINMQTEIIEHKMFTFRNMGNENFDVSKYIGHTEPKPVLVYIVPCETNANSSFKHTFPCSYLSS